MLKWYNLAMSYCDNRVELEKAINAVSPSFDINKVYLFGSFARGQQTETSDVDLCLETGQKFSLLNAVNYSKEIKALTGRDVDVVTERSLYPHVRTAMLKDRTLLYERV